VNLFPKIKKNIRQDIGVAVVTAGPGILEIA
jgi:hypothetical protein